MSRLSRMQVGFGALVLAASVVLAPAAAWSQPASPEDWEAPRTAWGDPDIGGSSPWARSDQPMFEYACHEGNYGLTNILAGLRMEEARTGER